MRFCLAVVQREMQEVTATSPLRQSWNNTLIQQLLILVNVHSPRNRQVAASTHTHTHNPKESWNFRMAVGERQLRRYAYKFSTRSSRAHLSEYEIIVNNGWRYNISRRQWHKATRWGPRWAPLVGAIRAPRFTRTAYKQITPRTGPAICDLTREELAERDSARSPLEISRENYIRRTAPEALLFLPAH